MPTIASSNPRRVPAPLAGLALLAITFLVYLPSLSNRYIWDDDDYVTQNLNLRSPEGLRRIWFEPGATRQYYPLVHTTFWIEYQAWGLWPVGYHITNTLLHAAVVLLVWIVLTRLSGQPGVAWVAAAVFAVHPVHVESVAWITERKNVLMGLFTAASLLAYTRFETALNANDADRPTATRSWRAYTLSLVLFVAAMFSKTVAAPLPVVIAVLLWWKVGRWSRRHLVPLAGFVLAAVPMGLMTIHMERQSVGATGPAFAFTGVERCLIAGRAAWFYAWKLLAPYDLMFIYPRWRIDVTQPWQYLFPIGVIAVLATCWGMRGKWGRGPLCAIASFLLFVAPALGFVSVYPMLYSFVADHFQYLGSIALVAGGVSCVAMILQRITNREARTRVAVVLTAIMLIVLGTRSIAQSANYFDAETLWRETSKVNPDSFMVYNNLGQELAKRGLIDEAIVHFERARELKSDHAPIYNNLGLAALHKGDYASAEANYAQALRVDPKNVRANANMGDLRLRQRRPQDAIPFLTAAIEIGGPNAVLYDSIGLALVMSGRVDDAKRAFIKAIELNPDFAEAHLHLATTLAQSGDLANAERQFRAVVALGMSDPNIWFALGRVILNQGRPADAIPCYRRGLALKPDSPEAHNEIGLAFAQLGRMPEAITAFREALHLRPDFPEARENLTRAMQGAP